MTTNEAKRAERQFTKAARVPSGDRPAYAPVEGLQIPKAQFDWRCSA